MTRFKDSGKGPVYDIQDKRPGCGICDSAFHVTAEHAELESQYNNSQGDRRRVSSVARSASSARPLFLLVLGIVCLAAAAIVQCTKEPAAGPSGGSNSGGRDAAAAAGGAPVPALAGGVATGTPGQPNAARSADSTGPGLR